MRSGSCGSFGVGHDGAPRPAAGGYGQCTGAVGIAIAMMIDTARMIRPTIKLNPLVPSVFYLFQLRS